MSHVLGIDSSTTATKAILVDRAGGVVGVASREYDYETPHPLWTEQDPRLWWDATVAAIR
jgi:xylulokinase